VAVAGWALVACRLFGALVALCRPRLAVGWLFCGFALCYGLPAAAISLVMWQASAGGPNPWSSTLGWLGVFIWIPAVAVFFPLIVLLFLTVTFPAAAGGGSPARLSLMAWCGSWAGPSIPRLTPRNAHLGRADPPARRRPDGPKPAGRQRDLRHPSHHPGAPRYRRAGAHHVRGRVDPRCDTRWRPRLPPERSAPGLGTRGKRPVQPRHRSALGISQKTVANYLSAIFVKLHVEDRAQAILLAPPGRPSRQPRQDPAVATPEVR